MKTTLNFAARVSRQKTLRTGGRAEVTTISPISERANFDFRKGMNTNDIVRANCSRAPQYAFEFSSWRHRPAYLRTSILWSFDSSSR
jgi:hypothetical protein